MFNKICSPLSYLLGLCSSHGDDAADSLGDGLLRHDDEGACMARVLQMPGVNGQRSDTKVMKTTCM